MGIRVHMYKIICVHYFSIGQDFKPDKKTFATTVEMTEDILSYKFPIAHHRKDWYR